MSASGVPIEEVTAKDFIMVRAALVSRLGGANEALVWSRVFYRCDEDSRFTHDTETGRWWAATYPTIAAETGLTVKQARSAVETLVSTGFLLREQHALRNNYDRAYSYQPVVIRAGSNVPQRADGTAQTGTPHVPQRADHHVPIRADVPYIETSKTEVLKTSTVPAGTTGSKYAQPLCDVLVAQLVGNGVKVPSPLPKKWLDDARLMIDRDEREPVQARDLIRWACADPFWRSNILSMPTFRKQYDKLRLAAERGGRTSMVDHGRSVDEELRRRAAVDHQAVSA